MEKHFLILVIFFVFVGFFIVKTSQFENYTNNLSSEKRFLNEQINFCNRLISRVHTDNQYENRLILL